MKQLRKRILDLPAHARDQIQPASFYLERGFSAADANDIIANWVELEEQEDEIAESALLHAWSILARLGGKEGREFLIEELDLSVSLDDEVFLQAFPDLMIASGPDVVPELIAKLEDGRDEEMALMEISSALTQFARSGIEADTIRETLVASLAGDPRHRSLKATIVGELLDLSGDACLEDIRKAFAANLVDVQIVGDIEEVEIQLGVRSERSTPKPDWEELEKVLAAEAELQRLGPRPKKGDDSAILHYFLELHAGPDSVRSLAELDGLILGAVLAPEMVKPSVLLPAIWDCENLEDSPDWESIEDAESFNTAAMNWQNQIIHGLDAGSYRPPVEPRLEPRIPTEEESDWARGILRSTLFWGRTNTEPSEFHQAFVASALHLIQPTDDTADADLIQLDMIVQIAHKLREAMQSGEFLPISSGPLEPFEREEPKVGRNDPCPCGSGLKYKRCCMN